MSETVGIVIPAYLPEVSLLREYVQSLASELDPEAIRIELDAPAESTRRDLEDVSATVNAVPDRRGKGAAISAGFDALETDVLLFADADGSTPPPELARIVQTVVDSSIDLAVGSRRHPDATVATSQSGIREYMGDGFAWLARRMLAVNLYDYQCGAKAIDADRWAEIRSHVTAEGFAWDVELIAIASAVDLEIREVPIEWHDHPESTVPPLRTAVGLGSTLLDARWRARDLEPARTESSRVDVGSPGVVADQDTHSRNDD